MLSLPFHLNGMKTRLDRNVKYREMLGRLGFPSSREYMMSVYGGLAIFAARNQLGVLQSPLNSIPGIFPRAWVGQDCLPKQILRMP